VWHRFNLEAASKIVHRRRLWASSASASSIVHSILAVPGAQKTSLSPAFLTDKASRRRPEIATHMARTLAADGFDEQMFGAE
jgi:hypothetical protein